MHSHHSHSGAFCRHASPSTSPESMLRLARSKGFTHYHLTEHVPRNVKEQLYPEEVEANLTPSDLKQTFDEYIKEARRQQALYADENNITGPMHVLVGAELENVDGRSSDCLDFLEQILYENHTKRQCRVDFCVGSVHHVNGIPIDFDKPTFERALGTFVQSDKVDNDVQIQQRQKAHLLLIKAYLEAQYILLQRFHPEVIGHFDLCRLFQPDTPMTVQGGSGGAADPAFTSELRSLLNDVDQAVRRNVAYAVAYGALFELNSASVRKGWPSPYPSNDVLDVIVEQNGRLCLSDDAHSHEQLALNYHVVLEYLNNKGIQHIWALERNTTKVDGQLDPCGIPCAFARGTIARPVPLTELAAFVNRNS